MPRSGDAGFNPGAGNRDLCIIRIIGDLGNVTTLRGLEFDCTIGFFNL
jgi:hypothetical protein